MAFESYHRSTPDIFADLLRQVATLARKEGQLARAEVSEKLGEAAVGIGLITAGAVLAIPAFGALLAAAIGALVEGGWSIWAASLLVGVVALVTAGILLRIGLSRLSAERLTPKRTIRQFQSVAQFQP